MNHATELNNLLAEGSSIKIADPDAMLNDCAPYLQCVFAQVAKIMSPDLNTI